MAYLPLVTPRPTHRLTHTCTSTDIFENPTCIHLHTPTPVFVSVICTLRMCFKHCAVCCPVMPHLRPFLPSFSSISIYLQGCQGDSHYLAHFLSFCSKQLSRTCLVWTWPGWRGEDLWKHTY